MEALKFPVTGEAASITGISSGVTALEITYQPDAPIATTERVEVTGAEVSWTPQKPGIAKIQEVMADGSSGAAIERSVKFESLPVSGVVVCLVAATLLVGGAAWATRLLLHLDGHAD